MRTLIDFDDAPIFTIPAEAGPRAQAREGMLIEGPQGWGEFSPPADAGPEADTRWLTAAVEAGTVGWPDPVRGRVPVAVAVPAVSVHDAHRIVGRSGCAAADVTVGDGSDLEGDLVRVRAVREALGPRGAVRCHAMGRWDTETAVRAITALDEAAGGLEFLRQPCSAVGDNAAVRRRVDVPIALDGWSLDPASWVRELREVADIVVVTVGPLGGVRRAMRVAETSGLPCVVASSGHTSVGLAGGLALAGALPELPFAVATVMPLTGDVVSPARSLVATDGHLPVSPMPPAPDVDLMAEFTAADPVTVARWRDRLRVAVHRLD